MTPRLAAVLAVSMAAAAVAAALPAPAATRAACPQSSLKGHNGDAPVDVDAAHAELQGQANRLILTGGVVVRQGDLTVAAPRMVAAYAKSPSTRVERLDASGGVVVRSPSETAKGAFGIYDLNQKIITLVGGVTLTRCDATVSGARLVYDLTNGHAVMDGGGVPGSSNPGGRVRGTFTVTQQRRPAG